MAEAYQAYRKYKEDVGETPVDAAIYLPGIAEILGIDLKQKILH